MKKKIIKKNKIDLELLAPAGNIEKLKTALIYGAQAVYLGIPDFSLRVRINDFDLPGIKAAVSYAHERGAKVYVTANIFAHNIHLSSFISYLKKLKDIGPDALIISDPGILSLTKKYWPEAEIHLSTQANCTNVAAAKFWAEQGVRRVILGREVSLKDIKEIHLALPELELEYFVHGAMCMSYSGRCFLSKLFVNRSGNLGDCAQPCRWQYDVNHFTLKAAGHEEELELVEEKHGSYLLNSKDLCLIKQLPLLVQAGITSFKIEGRAKSIYYQATVCAAYRKALNLILGKTKALTLKKELAYLYQELEEKLVHRGYTTGFLLNDKADQNISNSHNKSKWEFCGQALQASFLEKNKGANKNINKLQFKVHNTIKTGDQVEILLPGYEVIKFKLKKIVKVQTGDIVIEAHGGGGSTEVIIDLPANSPAVPALSVLRRKLVK